MKTMKVSKRAKRMFISPRDTKTWEQICSLKSDNCSTRDYWIQVAEKTVSITKQRSGGKASIMMWSIPKKQFNKLIDWYNKIQST